ncbi:hypothetical protein MRB53_030912 [Persea americana]|uniref:Uncharacterized protein n=1 Tax=Persea americana TaxID=3435 RepID=A0ACC2KMU9_PERAE|nr:hypothetical protein MRB53_030912 [Persea americana]
MADSTESILDNLTSKMTEVLSRVQTSSSPITDSPMVPISIKLDGSNYGLWSQVVEMYISGKDKLGYINGDYHHPPETDPSFRKWRTENAMVKGWLINSMDHSLVVNFIRYPTAKQVWDSAATTYFDGTDTSQGLWREIDFRRPNPMKCAIDIQSYNSILQEERVYTFLDGLDDRLDHVRSDVLRLQPFPSIEQAYAHVRREDLRQSVMISEAEAVTSGAVMAIKGVKSSQSQSLGPPHDPKVMLMGISALTVGVQDILGTPVSNYMATQTGGTNYKPERNEMLLQLKTSWVEQRWPWLNLNSLLFPWLNLLPQPQIKVIVVKFFSAPLLGMMVPGLSTPKRQII